MPADWEATRQRYFTINWRPGRLAIVPATSTRPRAAGATLVLAKALIWLEAGHAKGLTLGFATFGSGILAAGRKPRSKESTSGRAGIRALEGHHGGAAGGARLRGAWEPRHSAWSTHARTSASGSRSCAGEQRPGVEAAESRTRPRLRQRPRSEMARRRPP